MQAFATNPAKGAEDEDLVFPGNLFWWAVLEDFIVDWHMALPMMRAIRSSKRMANDSLRILPEAYVRGVDVHRLEPRH